MLNGTSTLRRLVIYIVNGTHERSVKMSKDEDVKRMCVQEPRRVPIVSPTFCFKLRLLASTLSLHASLKQLHSGLLLSKFSLSLQLFLLCLCLGFCSLSVIFCLLSDSGLLVCKLLKLDLNLCLALLLLADRLLDGELGGLLLEQRELRRGTTS